MRWSSRSTLIAYTIVKPLLFPLIQLSKSGKELLKVGNWTLSFSIYVIDFILMFLEIYRVLNISEVRLRVSMAMSPSQRPRGVLGFWASLMTALGNTESMPVSVLILLLYVSCLRYVFLWMEMTSLSFLVIYWLWPNHCCPHNEISYPELCPK